MFLPAVPSRAMSLHPSEGATCACETPAMPRHARATTLILPYTSWRYFAESLEDTPPRSSLFGRFGYASLSAEPFWASLRRLRRRAQAFERGFQGRVSLRFAEALKGLENLQNAATAAVSFAALTADKDLNNDSTQRARAKVEHFILTQVTPHLLFFELEASGTPPELLSVHLRSSAFVRSRKAYLSLLLKQRKHMLPWDTETVLEARKPYDAPLVATTALKQQLALSHVPSPFSEEPQTGDDADATTVTTTLTRKGTEEGEVEADTRTHGQKKAEEEKGTEVGIQARTHLDAERPIQAQQEGVTEKDSMTGKQRPLKEKKRHSKEARAETVSLTTAQQATQHSSQAIRKRALEAVDQGIRSQRLDVLAAVSLNAVSGIWGIDSKQRNYPFVRSKRNLSFGVSDAAVAAMVAAVRLEGPSLARRFYRLKRQILFAKEQTVAFNFSDRLAPVPLPSSRRTYTWSSAVSLVRAGFAAYLPFCDKELTKLIEEKRIDAAADPSKRPGSYTRPATPDTGPFVVVSFGGTIKDVRTLAREATHACLLSLRSPLGALAWVPPPALAETAARLGERILNEKLRADATTSMERLAQVMDELDVAANSILRQISYDRFEELVHEAREEGILFPEQFDKLWLQATEEMFGSEGTVFDSFGPIGRTWATVLHFHMLPFSVYLYALAPLMAELIAQGIETHPREAQQKLFAVLAATKDDSPLNLLSELQSAQSHGEHKNEDMKSERNRDGMEFGGKHSKHMASDMVRASKVEDDDAHLYTEEDDSEAEEPEKDPTEDLLAIEEEPLLFSQLFEALSINPQDVGVWTRALKAHFGALLDEAEALAGEALFGDKAAPKGKQLVPRRLRKTATNP
ncbi:peptidase family m3 protein [Cyclospora cayetanensis]|uniref:Peptidase family m3 protein n=1 Tax=Cyclospora cayetanensis TaxID=88456 RepID=A0A1D3DA83_9EIME|nr:peptidase family m3 protein [Cyclospora cayetanensis]